jgi:hypothetical protein
LRRAMREIGDDLTFARAKSAWMAVAQELAPKVGRNGKQISVKMLATRFAKETILGALTEFTAHPPADKHDAVHRAGGPFLRGVCEIAGDLLTTFKQTDLQNQRITRQLEDAVDFRCVRHPVVEAKTKTKASSNISPIT